MKYLISLFAFLLLISISEAQNGYMIPDIGTPGYSTYIEIIGNASSENYFGDDGFYINDNQADFQLTSNDDKIIISPFIVSWDGRLVSAHVFIPEDYPTSETGYTENNRVKIQYRDQNGVKSEYNFYVVQPTKIGDISFSTQSVFGEDSLGRRSPRGCMIIDSMRLNPMVRPYTVSTRDTDPNTSGNQGYLPFTLISLGRISGLVSEINVSANLHDAGPGGGGGAAASANPRSGNGFTAGGRGCHGVRGVGTFTDGASINGLEAGENDCDQGGGGGTGHPFGLSGLHGADVSDSRPGRYGAGSAGGERIQNTFGGGGGGYATRGEKGDGSSQNNGGHVTGNNIIVPICGGSGGGAGNVWNLTQAFDEIGGNGGGGGGAINIQAYKRIAGLDIISNGGNATDGVNRWNSGGGGGSGGSIIVGTKEYLNSVRVVVDGGTGGKSGGQGGNDGGNGGLGRVRADGRTEDISPHDKEFAKGVTISRNGTLNGTEYLWGTKDPNSEISIYYYENGWNFYQSLDDNVFLWEMEINPEDFEDTRVMFCAFSTNPGGPGGAFTQNTDYTSQMATHIAEFEAFCQYDYFIYPDFTDAENLNLAGEATIDGSSALLTDTRQNISGGIWRSNQVSVRDGFITTFSFRFTEGYNDFKFEGSLPGADGIAFTLQNTSPAALGYDGGGIGYKRVPNSLAVELDLYKNDNPNAGHTDPNGNHIAIQSNGILPNNTDHLSDANYGIVDDIPEVQIDGSVYYIRIDYNIVPNKLRVWFSDDDDFAGEEPVLISEDIALEDLLRLETHHRAFVGITSSTGSSYENHEILSWEFCSVTPPVDYTSVQTDIEKRSDIYPNPAQDFVYIDKVGVKSENIEYELINSAGFTVSNYTVENSGNRIQLNISDLSKGVYYLKVIEDNIAKVYKIIKN